MTLSSYAVPIFGGGLLMSVCYTLGRLDYSVFWVGIFVALNIITAKLWKEREHRIIALQHASLREKEVVLAHLKDLPAWVQFPDTERVEWLNKVIYQLWPYIGEYSKKFIKEFIEPQVRELLPAPFKSFHFEEIDMGDIVRLREMPLRVGGVKVYTENVGRDRIVMDMDVAYAGDCEFVVAVGLFKGGLRQMQFKGKLRAVLKPLLPKPPLIGGVSVYLLDEPTIDFDLTGLGEFVELPGLIGAVRTVVKAQVGSVCVLPNEIVVPLTTETDVVKLYFPEPDGIIRVHILEARNLENKDSFLRGKSDPYARLSIGNQSYKTKTIDNNLNPVWNEYFEAVIDQASGQKLLLETFDEDPGSNDELLGRMTMEMSVLRKRSHINEWFPLEAAKHGDIHLEMYFLELSTDVSLMGHDEAWEKAADKQLSDAILLVYIDNVSNLPYLKRDIEPSPFVQLSVGNAKQKTFVRQKTCNPLFQQKFVFFVSNVEHQLLKVEALDNRNGDKPLGDVTIPIRSVLKERKIELYQQTFHLALGPHLSPIVMTVRLRFLKLASSDENSPSSPKKTSDNNHSYLGTHPNMNQTVITYLSEKDKGLTDAMRNTTFSSGAETIHTRPTTGIVQKIQRSHLFNFGKLNKRRSASTTFDGYLGKIQLTLRYLVDQKKLSVNVLSAEQLHPVNYDGVADPYISIKVLKIKALIAKKKTHIQSHTLNPVFNEILEFPVEPDDVGLCSLSVDVKDSCNYGWFKRPPVLGHILYDLSRFNKEEPLTEWFPLKPPPIDRMSMSSVQNR